MHSLVEPNAWIALKLPSGNTRILQIVPNTTVSLGKYGSFPSNLIIHRPYHLTYELQDKRPPENFNRLRIVPAAELYSDILSATASSSSDEATPVPDGQDAEVALPTGVEYSLVDPESGAVVAITDRAELDAEARQTLTMEEIESLKKDGTDAGKDLIAKLMLSHTAIDQKTEYSLAKYKLLKTRKYIRRFSVLPLDVPQLDYWLLEDKDPGKILDMREEMVALLGCWANVHFGGEDHCDGDRPAKEEGQEGISKLDQTPGRWLVVDDTGGLLVAAMAERMGILYPPSSEKTTEETPRPRSPKVRRKETPGEPTVVTTAESSGPASQPTVTNESPNTKPQPQDNELPEPKSPLVHRRQIGGGRQRTNDLQVPYAHANTLTVVHANSQPNLTFLRYYDFDMTNPTHSPTHPLTNHLMSLSWLQLLEPELDATYSSEAPSATPEELRSWKANRRGTYHRKRRRWARTRHVIDSTRSGGFSGLVVASTMDPISIMRHAVPLLAGGAPIAIYSQAIEPLTALADCYSIARRGGWVTSPPDELVGKSAEEQEHWGGNDEFPLNPALVLGAAIQTSRVRRWQVLPGRTHPLMTSKGGAEGFVFTAWRVKPAEGKVEARGKQRSKKRKVDVGVEEG